MRIYISDVAAIENAEKALGAKTISYALTDNDSLFVYTMILQNDEKVFEAIANSKDENIAFREIQQEKIAIGEINILEEMRKQSASQKSVRKVFIKDGELVIEFIP